MEKACETCVHKDKSAFSATCVECGIAMMNYEHMTFTNADRVRAMRDEELATWINHMQADAYERGMMETAIVDYPNTYSNWLDWLRQEVNDGKEEKEENQPAK